MTGLVRDVSDFMMPDELALEPEKGIRKYCRRLAQIYKDEESISGMPINMDSFHLFDSDHRSSYPLNIAHKSAQLTDPEKAYLYLYNLRYATIVETRQTTLLEELSAIAAMTGIDQEAFNRHMNDGSAEAAFREDLQYTRSLGIYSLPAYLLQYGDNTMLIKQLIGYEAFVSAITQLSGNNVNPFTQDLSYSTLYQLLKNHPLISQVEIREAFDLKTPSEVQDLMSTFVKDGKVTYTSGFYRVV